MKRVQAARHGDPSVLELVELPDPEPGPGELLVRVEAAGVNFIDTYLRSGAYPAPLPLPMGAEGAGVVAKRGPGIDDVQLAVGARVAWSSAPGSYATHVLVAAERAVRVPEGLASEIAAAAMLQGMTAHYLAHATFPLRPGHTCLVHAGAGGVGLLLCQMAKKAGARVLTTVSTEAKAELARGAGADEAILYTKQPFEAAVRAATSGRGVDVVYDSVGKDTFDASLASLAPRGMLVLFGQSSGRVPPVDPQVLSTRGSVFLTRPTLAHYVATRAELLERAGAVLGAALRGELSVRIGARFPLAQAAEAHRALEGRHTTGKVVLLP